jgi:hypothetical protein
MKNLCSVASYITLLVRYVKRKNDLSIVFAFLIQQACYGLVERGFVREGTRLPILSLSVGMTRVELATPATESLRCRCELLPSCFFLLLKYPFTVRLIYDQAINKHCGCVVNCKCCSERKTV